MNKNHALADKAAGYIAAGILSLQRKFANVLHNISASWKIKQKWIFLYLVCLVFGGLSVVAIVKPFNGFLRKPAAIRIPKMLPGQKAISITDAEIKNVRAFKESLDSVTKAHRPGLMDSLEKVEQLYYSQKKLR